MAAGRRSAACGRFDLERLVELQIALAHEETGRDHAHPGDPSGGEVDAQPEPEPGAELLQRAGDGQRDVANRRPRRCPVARKRTCCACSRHGSSSSVSTGIRAVIGASSIPGGAWATARVGLQRLRRTRDADSPASIGGVSTSVGRRRTSSSAAESGSVSTIATCAQPTARNAGQPKRARVRSRQDVGDHIATVEQQAPGETCTWASPARLRAVCRQSFGIPVVSEVCVMAAGAVGRRVGTAHRLIGHARAYRVARTHSDGYPRATYLVEQTVNPSLSTSCRGSSGRRAAAGPTAALARAASGA